MKLRQQGTTTHPIAFLMVDSSDHITGKTGLTPTVTISKDGASFGSPSGAVSELANGWYLLAGNATDRATLGDFLIHATASGADPVDDKYVIVAFDPFSATNLGLSYLAGDAYARLGAPAGASHAADIAAVKSDTGKGIVRSNTAQAGASASITLDASASATTDLYKGLLVVITGGTGAGQVRVVTSYGGVSKIATVDRAWATNPDNTSVFTLLAADLPKVDANQRVDASLAEGGDLTDAMQAASAAAITSAGVATATNVTDARDHIENHGDTYWVGGGAVGSGAISFTYTLTNALTDDPIPGVDVWVTTDEAGDNVVAGTLVTDAFGRVTFLLDAGTYFFWRQASGWSFTNPDQEEVS